MEAATRRAIDRILHANDLDNYWRRYQLSGYPALATQGNFQIKEFETTLEARRGWIIKEGAERDPGSGTFHKLVENFPGEVEEDGSPKGELVWMGDTRAEILEHMPFFQVLLSTDHVKHKRVLINGLGLGMVTHAAAAFEGVESVDVVDCNEDIIKLVMPLLPPNVSVHLGDAYEIEWPKNYRWDMIWHDIWPTISEDNIPEMMRLKNKYRRKGTWQGFWQIEGCRSQARFYKAMENNTLPLEHAYAYLHGIAPWNLGY